MVFDDFQHIDPTTEEQVLRFFDTYGIGLTAAARLIGMDPKSLYNQLKGWGPQKVLLKESTIERLNQLYGTKFQVNPGSKASKHNPPAAPDGSDDPSE